MTFLPSPCASVTWANLIGSILPYLLVSLFRSIRPILGMHTGGRVMVVARVAGTPAVANRGLAGIESVK